MSEKDKHIDWMNEQDAALTREAKQHDFAGEVELEEVFFWYLLYLFGALYQCLKL